MIGQEFSERRKTTKGSFVITYKSSSYDLRKSSSYDLRKWTDDQQKSCSISVLASSLCRLLLAYHDDKKAQDKAQAALDYAYSTLRSYFPRDEYMSLAEIHAITGWGPDLVGKALLTRTSDQDFENAMVSEGVTHILRPRQAYRWIKAPRGEQPRFRLERVRRGQSVGKAVDIMAWIKDAQRRVEKMEKDTQVTIPGHVEAVVTRQDGGEADPESNVFATGTCEADMLVEEEATGPFTEDGIPTISSPEHLAYYGFALIDAKDTTVFTINSPTGLAPIIPLYVGSTYSSDIRGGFYIEKHDPVHLWAPLTPDAGGFITVAKAVSTTLMLPRSSARALTRPQYCLTPSCGRTKLPPNQLHVATPRGYFPSNDRRHSFSVLARRTLRRSIRRRSLFTPSGEPLVPLLEEAPTIHEEETASYGEENESFTEETRSPVEVDTSEEEDEIVEEEKHLKLFRFAKVKIPYGKLLVCAPQAWHCDGTLSGGVFLTSFGFQKGPEGDREDTGYSGIQPLRSAAGKEIKPKF